MSAEHLDVGVSVESRLGPLTQLRHLKRRRRVTTDKISAHEPYMKNIHADAVEVGIFNEKANL